MSGVDMIRPRPLEGDDWVFCSPSAVFTHPSLTHHEKLILVYLYRKADQQGACWPSQPTIAKACGLGERTVRRYLGALKEKGLIQYQIRTGDSPIYQLPPVEWRPHLEDRTESLPPIPPRPESPPRPEVPGTPATPAAPPRPERPTKDEHPRMNKKDEHPDARVGEILSVYGTLKPTLISRWLTEYPDLDVVAEVRAASLWEEENPSKAKKSKPRFLGAWLRRAASPEKAPQRPATGSEGGGATTEGGQANGKRLPKPWQFESEGRTYPIRWWGWRYGEYKWSNTWPHWEASRQNAISQGCPPEDLEGIPVWGRHEGGR